MDTANKKNGRTRRRGANGPLPHPIDLLNEQIERNGLAVIDKVDSMPAAGAPYMSPHFVIGINQGGVAHARYDMHQVEFRKHDISVIYPNHILQHESVTADYEATLIVVSGSLFAELRYRHPYRNHFEFLFTPSFHLTDEQYEAMMHLVGLLRTIERTNDPSKHDLLIGQLEVLALLLGQFYREHGGEMFHSASSGRQLFTRFYDALVDHCHESREVGFYAELLCMSPKYFGMCIKKETGIGASEWIANFSVLQAKSLLDSRYDLNIQQVSERLGFPSQAAFSRYFKTNTGITPLEYRKRY